MELKNKVAIVTGSSMGIGKAIALELAQNGVRVILNGRDEKKLYDTETEFLKNGYEATAIVADVGRPEQCELLINETIKAYGKIDILVNNAGESSRGSVEKMAVSNITELMNTNYSGAAFLSKYAVPHLRESKGHIVFINSVGGLRGMPYNSAYTASKMAQAALAEALRIELYDSGIHVGVVYVSFTENEPKKIIYDVDGKLIYLPKRNNVHLAKRSSVAKSVRLMIIHRKNKTVLGNLGILTNFIIRYFPWSSNMILLVARKKIKTQFTDIGGKKVEIHHQESKAVHTYLNRKSIDNNKKESLRMSKSNTSCFECHPANLNLNNIR